MVEPILHRSAPPAEAVPTQDDPRGVKAVGRAMSILDAFLDGAETLTLSEVAQRANLPRSTCHRVLDALVRRNYLERTEGSAYRLGMRLFQLGALVQGPRSLAAVADAEMTRLADATRVSAFLSVRDGDRSICIHRVDRGQVILAPYRVGETLPLHVGAAPLLLLAAMDDADVDHYLAQPLVQLTTKTEVRPEHIRARLAAIRSDGYVVARPDDIATGITAVGAAIAGPDGRVIAALSLSGLTSDIEPVEESLLEQVKRSANVISRLLARTG